MARDSTDFSAPPAAHLFLLEAPRACVELAGALWLAPFLRLAPPGDGHPVLVLPGLSGSDRSTWVLRSFLRDRGYLAHGWDLGRNYGRPGVEEKLKARLAELTDRHGRKISVIGWSLGGIYARNLAHHAPESVRCVITLGSPFTGNPRASNVWPMYELMSGRRADDWPARERNQRPPPVPSTAIYSRNDGVVAWQCCVEGDGPLAESIEVDGSHSGLGHNPAVLYAVADRLSQPEGMWQPFDDTGPRRFFFRKPVKPTSMSGFASGA